MRSETERPYGAIDDLIDPLFDQPCSVDDGFCCSSFSEDRHGWLRTQRKGRDNPAVVLACAVLDLHEENNELRRRLYEMAKQTDMWRQASGMFGKAPPLVPPMSDDGDVEAMA